MSIKQTGFITFVLHILAFVGVLTVRTSTLHPSDALISSDFWVHWYQTLLFDFPTPTAQLLVLFFILCPTWAVFSSRNRLFSGFTLLFLTFLWYVCVGLWAGQILVFPIWPVWFLYASSLLLLSGLFLIIAIFKNPHIKNTSDETHSPYLGD